MTSVSARRLAAMKSRESIIAAVSARWLTNDPERGRQEEPVWTSEANTGSDAGNMACTAVKDGNEWVINGTKNWITHGISGDIAVVVTRTGEPRARNNATTFVVERGTPDSPAGKKRIN